MMLVSVYKADNYEKAVRMLYRILKQRPLEHGISHRKMPTWEEHWKFVARRPFRHWLIIVVKIVTLRTLHHMS